MNVILDNRERDLMRIFKDDPSYNVKQLDIGDVHFNCPSADSGSEPKIAVIAERKAVADLEASLTDGRYREQRTRLLATCAEKERPRSTLLKVRWIVSMDEKPSKSSGPS